MSWSDAPPEILSEIAQRLKNRSEVLSFRAVCNTWRRSAPLPLLANKSIISSNLPHHFTAFLPGDQFKYAQNHITERRLVLSATSVLLFQSVENPNQPPFMVAAEELSPGKLFVRLPLYQYIFRVLPENFPNNMDLSGLRVSEITRFYGLSEYSDSNDDDVVIRAKNELSYMLNKVVLKERNGNTNSGLIHNRDVILLYNDGCDGALAKIKLNDGSMVPLHGRGIKRFDDAVNFNGKLYVIDRKGQLFYLEKGASLCKVVNFSDPIGDGSASDTKKRLFVSFGELYLLYRYPYDEAFKIYKRDEERKIWNELEGIGHDRILFATEQVCFFVPANDIPTFEGNILVFASTICPSYSSVYRYASFQAITFEGIKVFHFETGECKPIDYYPGYLDVVQPPSWL